MTKLVNIHKDMNKKRITKERRIFWAGLHAKRQEANWKRLVEFLYSGHQGFKPVKEQQKSTRWNGAAKSIPENYNSRQL